MAEVFTDGAVFTAAISKNTDGSDPVVEVLGWTEVDSFGATETRTPSNLVTTNRQQKEGQVLARESGAGFTSELHGSLMRLLLGPALESKVVNESITNLRVTTGLSNPTGYTLGANATTEQVADSSIGTLFQASGFRNAANNGLKAVSTTAPSTSSAAIRVTGESALVGGDTGRLNPVGVRVTYTSANLSAWAYRAVPNTATLTLPSNTTIKNLEVGMTVVFGTRNDADTANQNALQSTSGNKDDSFGSATITAITQSAGIVTSIDFENVKGTTLQRNGGVGAGNHLDIQFGNFSKVTNEGDPFHQLYRWDVERTLVGLGNSTVQGANNTRYKYSEHNRLNTMTMTIPTQDYIGLAFDLQGRNTSVEEATRRSIWADAASTLGDLIPDLTTSVGSGELGLPLFELNRDGSPLNVILEDTTLTIDHSLSTEGAPGHTGAVRTTPGTYSSNLDTTVSYSDDQLAEYIRQSTRLNYLDIAASNEFWVCTHVPSVNLSSDGEDHERGSVVKLSGTLNSSDSNIYGTSTQFTMGYARLPR